MEFSRRLKVDDVWPKELLAKKPQYRGKTLFDMLYANGQVNKYPLSQGQKGLDAKRLDLATHVWKSMKAADSREFRNCHDSSSMEYRVQERK